MNGHASAFRARRARFCFSLIFNSVILERLPVRSHSPLDFVFLLGGVTEEPLV